MSVHYRNMTGLLLAGFSFKFLAFFTGFASAYAAQIYMLIITILAAISVDASLSLDGKRDYLFLFKSAMRPVALFSLLTGIFTWFFYSAVDTSFLELMIRERLQAAISAGQSESALQGLESNLRVIFSPRAHSLVVGAALLGYGLFSTALFSILLPRFRR